MMGWSSTAVTVSLSCSRLPELRQSDNSTKNVDNTLGPQRFPTRTSNVSNREPIGAATRVALLRLTSCRIDRNSLSCKILFIGTRSTLTSEILSTLLPPRNNPCPNSEQE